MLKHLASGIMKKSVSEQKKQRDYFGADVIRFFAHNTMIARSMIKRIYKRQKINVSGLTGNYYNTKSQIESGEVTLASPKRLQMTRLLHFPLRYERPGFQEKI